MVPLVLSLFEVRRTPRLHSVPGRCKRILSAGEHREQSIPVFEIFECLLSSLVAELNQFTGAMKLEYGA